MRNPSSRQPRQLTDSILEYLARYEQYAARTNDSRMAWHFTECWRTVFIAFYGGYSVPRMPSVRCPEAQAESIPAAKPLWRVQKYSRPARKVIAQVKERQRGSKRLLPVDVIYDVLACGHRMLAAWKEDGSMTSKWRYCNECQPVSKAATCAGQLDRGAA